MLPNSAAPTGLPDSRTGVIAAVLAPRVDDLSSLACGVRLAGPDALDGEMAEAARLWWNEARAVFGRCDAAGGQQAVGEAMVAALRSEWGYGGPEDLVPSDEGVETEGEGPTGDPAAGGGEVTPAAIMQVAERAWFASMAAEDVTFSRDLPARREVRAALLQLAAGVPPALGSRTTARPYRTQVGST